jgi:hypothetical protein
MDEEMQQLTMSAIGRAMFSIDLVHELTDVGRAFREAFDFIFTPNMSQASLPFSSLLPSNRRFRRNPAAMDAFTARRIEAGERRTPALHSTACCAGVTCPTAAPYPASPFF